MIEGDGHLRPARGIGLLTRGGTLVVVITVVLKTMWTGIGAIKR
jgi:hypothetical protein